MSETVYRNLGELVEEAKKKYPFDRNRNGKRKRHFYTGFSRVVKVKNNSYKQGFNYQYRYQDNGTYKNISSVNIRKLRDRVIGEGLEWGIVDKKEAQKIANFHNIDINELK